MKKFLCFMLIIGFAIPAIFAGGGSDRGAASGAQDGPTGKIVIYTSIYEDVIEAMERVLSRQFRNLDVEFFYGGTGALQAKIAAEQA